MTDMFLERSFDPPLDTNRALGMALDAAGCFRLHGIRWHRSMLSSDGRRLVCWFSGPDMESVRIALRQINADVQRLWRGTVHNAPGLEEDELRSANVLVIRSFEDPVELHDMQVIEDAGAWCLETRDVRFIRTYFAADHKRMVCLYEAPDAESVRQAQREAGVPFDDAWSVLALGPRDIGCTSH